MVEVPNTKPDVFDGARLRGLVKNDAVNYPVSLPGRDTEPIKIRTERWELVNVPGSYHFYIQEFSKGLRVRIEDHPPDIDVDVRVRPQGRGDPPSTAGNTYLYNNLTYPGQGVEITFTKKR